MLYGVGALQPLGPGASVQLREATSRVALCWSGEGASGRLEGLGIPRPPKAHLAFPSPPQSGNPGLVFGGLRKVVTLEAGLHLTSENLSR